MSKGKTGLIVLTGLAAMFFLFVAILFGSSTQRQAALNRRDDLNAKLIEFTKEDLAVYWIGELPKELEQLSPVVKTVAPSAASKDTLPVRGPEFHIIEKDPEGNVTKEEFPIDYPSHMLIVITGNPVLSDAGKEALLDAIAKNGVPVIAIGDEAPEFLSGVMSRARTHKGEGSSLYYCRGKGYKENLISKEAVINGGMDLAEAVPEVISKAISDYSHQ